MADIYVVAGQSNAQRISDESAHTAYVPLQKLININGLDAEIVTMTRAVSISIPSASALDWYPFDDGDSTTGEMITYLTRAIDAKLAQPENRLAGIIWFHGEADAAQSRNSDHYSSENYERSLAELHRIIQGKYGDDVNFTVMQLNSNMPGSSAHQYGFETVQAAQASFVENDDTGAVLFDTHSRITKYHHSVSEYLYRDNWHFSEHGYDALAYEFLQQFNEGLRYSHTKALSSGDEETRSYLDGNWVTRRVEDKSVQDWSWFEESFDESGDLVSRTYQLDDPDPDSGIQIEIVEDLTQGFLTSINVLTDEQVDISLTDIFPDALGVMDMTVDSLTNAVNGTSRDLGLGLLRYTPDSGVAGYGSFDVTGYYGSIGKNLSRSVEVFIIADPNTTENLQVFGSARDDNLTGANGDDTFYALAGVDTIDGGEGTDTYVFEGTAEQLVVKMQDDGTYHIQNLDAITYDTLINVEKLRVGSTSQDLANFDTEVLTATYQASGTAVNATSTPTAITIDPTPLLEATGIEGLTLVEVGNAIVGASVSMAGQDLLFTPGANTAGFVTFDFTAEKSNGKSYLGTAEVQIDVPSGISENLAVYGSAEDDTLTGGDGDDTFHTSAGADILDGSGGADTYLFGDNNDKMFVTAQGDGSFQIDNTDGSVVALKNFEYVKALDSEAQALSDFAQVITLGTSRLGSAITLDPSNAQQLSVLSAEPLFASLPAEPSQVTLTGVSAENSWLNVEIHENQLHFSHDSNIAGTFLFRYKATDKSGQQYQGRAEIDIVADAITAASGVTLYGSSSDNTTLNGSAGDDWIEGSGGTDIINGGNGIDTYVYNHARQNFFVDAVGNGTYQIRKSADEALVRVYDILEEVERLRVGDVTYDLSDFDEASSTVFVASSNTVAYQSQNPSITIAASSFQEGLSNLNGSLTLTSAYSSNGTAARIENNSAVIPLLSNYAGFDTFTFEGHDEIGFRYKGTIQFLINDVSASQTAHLNIYGSDLTDSLNGGAGDDIFYASAANDILLGGEGSDTYIYSGEDSDFYITAKGNSEYEVYSPDNSKDTLKNIEKIQIGSTLHDLSSFDDEIVEQVSLTDNKGTFQEVLVLQADDVLGLIPNTSDLHLHLTQVSNLSHNGTIVTDVGAGVTGNFETQVINVNTGPTKAGFFTFDYEAENSQGKKYSGSAQIEIEAAADTSSDQVIAGAEDNNTILGSNGNDTLYGNEGDDILTGGGGDDALYGGTGTDKLYGGDGNDTFEGGEGADFIYGGDGIDTYISFLDPNLINIEQVGEGQYRVSEKVTTAGIRLNSSAQSDWDYLYDVEQIMVNGVIQPLSLFDTYEGQAGFDDQDLGAALLLGVFSFGALGGWLF